MSKLTDEEIYSALHFDALLDAEKLTGKSYKEDKFTESIGFLSFFKHNEYKNRMLQSLDDTTLTNKLSNYLRIVEDEGFEKVLDLPFEIENRKEILYVFWHNDGILLVFTTYQSDQVDGGHFNYNVVFDKNKSPDWHSYTSSGCAFDITDDKIYWSGDHDCRVGLRFNIRMLREHGEFLSVWKNTPFLALLHSADYLNDDKNDFRKSFDDHRAITAERIKLLPQYVQDAIRGENEDGLRWLKSFLTIKLSWYNKINEFS